MSKKTLEEGFRPFDLRYGLTAPLPRGMKRQGDPAKILPNQFYTLQNARIIGSQVVERGGQSKVNTSGALTGTIYGIWDDLNN